MSIRKQMKSAAKINLARVKNPLILTCVLYSVFSIFSNIISSLIRDNITPDIRGFNNAEDFFDYFVNSVSEQYDNPAFKLYDVLVLLASIFLLPALLVSVYSMLLKARGGIGATPADCLTGFSIDYTNVIVVNLTTGIITLLWFFVFIIPGIIKVLQYCLVPVILASNPSVGASRARKLSRELMDGHKLEYIVLLITFIGWFIVGAIFFGIFRPLYVMTYWSAVVTEFYSLRRREAIENGTLDPQELPSFGNDWYAPFYDENGVQIGWIKP